ncbi:YkgJ family cysteine cluster protein [Flavihumibacter fluvii]|uniref:YkgJ family cysteine cluster protein n=1 Tax=Flavihumibacter fluvii TaxID=2838157 RepID=UPI001BDF2B38|nr:YkgJ family cysteine cluster protein [Flavihumibacter fluvii]ULQ53125.1 YkgJ family cysteine cluster protein [Flavihumibacter fluvii]
MSVQRNPRDVNLRQLKKQFNANKRKFRRFITKVENERPRGIDQLTPVLEKEVWEEVDCLTCANCCKKMTPTFTTKDISRISAHFEMTPAAFKEKWLVFEKKDRDWVNVKRPCQFLDLKTNMCSIYAIRPSDCAGFPYLSKKKAVDYVHVHKQNIEYCPATYKMVEKMKARLAP